MSIDYLLNKWVSNEKAKIMATNLENFGAESEILLNTLHKKLNKNSIKKIKISDCYAFSEMTCVSLCKNNLFVKKRKFIFLDSSVKKYLFVNRRKFITLYKDGGYSYRNYFSHSPRPLGYEVSLSSILVLAEDYEKL